MTQEGSMLHTYVYASIWWKCPFFQNQIADSLPTSKKIILHFLQCGIIRQLLHPTKML